MRSDKWYLNHRQHYSWFRSKTSWIKCKLSTFFSTKCLVLQIPSCRAMPPAEFLSDESIGSLKGMKRKLMQGREYILAARLSTGYILFLFWNLVTAWGDSRLTGPRISEEQDCGVVWVTEVSLHQAVLCTASNCCLIQGVLRVRRRRNKFLCSTGTPKLLIYWFNSAYQSITCSVTEEQFGE